MTRRRTWISIARRGIFPVVLALAVVSGCANDSPDEKHTAGDASPSAEHTSGSTSSEAHYDSANPQAYLPGEFSELPVVDQVMAAKAVINEDTDEEINRIVGDTYYVEVPFAERNRVEMYRSADAEHAATFEFSGAIYPVRWIDGQHLAVVSGDTDVCRSQCSLTIIDVDAGTRTEVAMPEGLMPTASQDDIGVVGGQLYILLRKDDPLNSECLAQVADGKARTLQCFADARLDMSEASTSLPTVVVRPGADADKGCTQVVEIDPAKADSTRVIGSDQLCDMQVGGKVGQWDIFGLSDTSSETGVDLFAMGPGGEKVALGNAHFPAVSICGTTVAWQSGEDSDSVFTYVPGENQVTRIFGPIADAEVYLSTCPAGKLGIQTRRAADTEGDRALLHDEFYIVDID